jgi:hypothetical protein
LGAAGVPPIGFGVTCLLEGRLLRGNSLET